MLPKIFREKGRKFLCFSITLTGKCNAHCSYCHFYARKARKKVMCDISEELFESYLLFVREVIKKFSNHKDIQVGYRFSGGEPLILGEKLFRYAQRAYEITGEKPFILTNGKAINEEFIKIAKRYNSIGHLYVSIENPLNPDPGAPNPFAIIEKIKKFSSEDLPIVPGVVVIKNEHFKDLFKIARFLYKELNGLPTFSERGYGLYSPPTKRQLRDLYKNIEKIITHYSQKVKIVLFPSLTSVSSLYPKFCGGWDSVYIIGLGLENKYGITRRNIKEKFPEILEQFDSHYPHLKCEKEKCRWRDGCRRILGGWLKGWGKLLPEECMKSYCEFKKTIYKAVENGSKHVKDLSR